ncbi:UNVERIFIED_CONTAM: hypothetical protein RMT77_014834 [Armadillidium vulgare]
MDIKSEIEIKDEFLSPDFRYDGESSEQDSWFDEVQGKNVYPNIDIKDEIEIQDEELDFKEEYAEGQHIDPISGLDESQAHHIRDAEEEEEEEDGDILKAKISQGISWRNEMIEKMESERFIVLVVIFVSTPKMN